MYDAASGIEVYIRPYREDDSDSEGQYAEYEAPRGTPLYTGNARERFIEAVTNERYEIVTILHPAFTFKGCHCVKVYKNIDGSLNPRAYLEARRRGSKTAMTNCSKSARTLVDGVWKEVGYSFGLVSPSEHVDISSEQETSEAKKRGRIVVKVQRGSVESKACDQSRYGNATFMPDETTKNVAVLLGKSHGLKLVVLQY